MGECKHEQWVWDVGDYQLCADCGRPKELIADDLKEENADLRRQLQEAQGGELYKQAFKLACQVCEKLDEEYWGEEGCLNATSAATYEKEFLADAKEVLARGRDG
jgi:hypothetical protein